MYYEYKETEWEKRNRESKKCIYMPQSMRDKLSALQGELQSKGIEVSYSSLIRKAFDIAFSQLQIECKSMTQNELAEGKCQW